MTYRECAIVMAYTGVCTLRDDNLKYFYEYIYDILGFKLYTHQLPIYADRIRNKSANDFLDLCKNANKTTDNKDIPQNVKDAITFLSGYELYYTPYQKAWDIVNNYFKLEERANNEY